jgi:hypothetical protein
VLAAGGGFRFTTNRHAKSSGLPGPTFFVNAVASKRRPQQQALIPVEALCEKASMFAIHRGTRPITFPY